MTEANPHHAELAEKMRTILTLPTSNVKGSRKVERFLERELFYCECPHLFLKLGWS